MLPMPSKWNVVVNGQVVSWCLVESAADRAALNLRRAGWGMAYVERGEDATIGWHSVAPHVFEFAAANHYPIRLTGKFPFELREVWASEDDVVQMYDHFTP
jgi:hypothetical protein